jgi:hypothetical protein
MPLQGLIGQQCFGAGKLLGQLHFIVQIVNAVVTKPANIDAPVQSFPVKIFSIESTPMQFFGNEVMKG